MDLDHCMNCRNTTWEGPRSINPVQWSWTWSCCIALGPRLLTYLALQATLSDRTLPIVNALYNEVILRLCSILKLPKTLYFYLWRLVSWSSQRRHSTTLESNPACLWFYLLVKKSLGIVGIASMRGSIKKKALEAEVPCA